MAKGIDQRIFDLAEEIMDQASDTEIDLNAGLTRAEHAKRLASELQDAFEDYFERWEPSGEAGK